MIELAEHDQGSNAKAKVATIAQIDPRQIRAPSAAAASPTITA